MINLKEYRTLKLKNVVSILKTTGGTFAVAYSKYDTSTGEKLSDEVFSVDLEELAIQKAELQTQVKEIDAFVADCQAIK